MKDKPRKRGPQTPSGKNPAGKSGNRKSGKPSKAQRSGKGKSKKPKKSPQKSVAEILDELRSKDPRYPTEAYRFVFESLEFTLLGLDEPRHVSGPELLDGIREYALEQFGPMARTVFDCWNVGRTQDFGHMVFNLVDCGLLGKNDDDRLDDFKDVYDFEQAFQRPGIAKLSPRRRPS